MPLAAALTLLAAVLLAAVPAKATGPQGSAQELLASLALQRPTWPLPNVQVVYDSYGFSVALSGDTALVGAPYDDVGGNGAQQGSAYIFVRSGATWTCQQRLTAFDGGNGDHFGAAVAVSSDVALVGANGGDTGSVYVFVHWGQTWTCQQRLTAADSANGFGTEVALSGDTALVGEPYAHVGGTLVPGSAYVFVRSGTTWSQQQKLTADDGSVGEGFGNSVALSGDTALVGEPYDNVGGSEIQGSAYVFVRSGATWSQQQKLTAPDGAAEDYFGWSVALSNDTALVGAPLHTIGANSGQGSAYVFVRSGASWAFQQQLVDGDGGPFDRFGDAVATSGDTALVGAPLDTIGANYGQGSACVFVRSGATWTLQQLLVNDGGVAFSYLGAAVALSGDTALLGEPSDWRSSNPSARGPGSAYIFSRSGATWTRQAQLVKPDVVAPVTTASIAPPANAAGWSKTPVAVALTATDAVSGVAGSEYRRAGASSWTPYAAPFVVAAQGTSTYEYRSSDLAGNLEAAKRLEVRIDGRRPTTVAHCASVRRGEKVRLVYRVDDALPGCGRATAWIKVYEGTKLRKMLKAGVGACNLTHRYAWRCRLAKGSYTLKVYARDLAGNTQRKVGSARLTVR